MTLEQMRIKIAEACGWKYLWETECEGWRGNPPDGSGDAPIPDPYDLNACHEMEKVLTPEQLAVYGNLLDDITRPKNTMEMSYVHNPEAGMYPELFRATATQRCEAFLKTLELLKS